MKRNWIFLKNLLLPTLLFSFVSGTLTGMAVLLYRLVSGWIIGFSESTYGTMRLQPLWILAAVAVIALIALGTAFLYRRIPNIRGGGIPTAIAILRGSLPFRWWQNFLGVWVASLSTFLIGIPLGTEGPCVQMGTAVGRGTVKLLAPRHGAWDRYVMTGGACAGFTAATGAPISGILFAVEEAHGRISPMILMVAFSSTLFADATLEAMAPFFGLQGDLFPGLDHYVMQLDLRELWLPLLVGVLIGGASVLFLRSYHLVQKLWHLGKRPLRTELRILLVAGVTLALGLVSYDFISTGHHLTDHLLYGSEVWYLLLLILVARGFIMLAANTTGITGGMFLPIMTLGAIIASLCGQGLITLGWIPEAYRTTVVVLGITACIAGMIKTPMTAIVFAIEALGCGANVLPVILTVTAAYLVTELCGAQSINEIVVESRVEEFREDSPAPTVIDTFVTVRPDTFAVGKQIRDIFWPCNLFVLSIKRDPVEGAKVDQHGDKTIHPGDILHVRYSCYDEAEARRELFAIVGEQSIEEQKVEKV